MRWLILVGILLSSGCGRCGKVILSGEFHSVAHKGSGFANVEKCNSGMKLRIRGLRTYPADDLEILLVAAQDAQDNDTVRRAGFIELGSLRQHGDPEFVIPTRTDLSRFRAVSVWSRRYGVNFTTAPLQ